MPEPIFTAKPLGDSNKARSMPALATACERCKFQDTFKDKQSGKYKDGDWRQAIVERGGVVGGDTQARRQNVNDWLKFVPVVCLPKGTELFHVTSDSTWVRKSLPGTNHQDGYGFFTSRDFGFAQTHNTSHHARIQMRLKVDVHGFFCPSYDFLRYDWKGVEVGGRERNITAEEQNKLNQALLLSPGASDVELSRRTTPEGVEVVTQWKQSLRPGKVADLSFREKVDKSAPDKGGGLIDAISEAWPNAYRPALIVGCSECEFIFHSSVIPAVMEVTAAATSTDNFAKDKKIVGIGELPAALTGTGSIPGIGDPPSWMSPNNFSADRLKKLQQAADSKTLDDPRLTALFS